MKKKSNQIVLSELFARVSHIVVPSDAYPGFKIQAVDEQGALKTLPCTEAIFKKVLGTRTPSKYGPGDSLNWGLRQLTGVKFRLHFDSEGTVQAIDTIPNRLYTSGPAPRFAGRAGKSGFTVHWDEDLQGFDVWTEHPETGDKMRIAYAGMSEKGLCDLLDELRTAVWTAGRKQQTLSNHRVDKREDDVFRVRPLADPKYTT